jgi:SRSO17 transposase
MERRFEVRKEELVKDSVIKGPVFDGALERLISFAKPFVDLLPRDEHQAHLQTYLGGLVSDLDRKNIEAIAYRNDQDRMNLQRFIGWGAWEHTPLMTEVARQVGEKIGEDDGVLVFDPSGFKKSGKSSVGVKRQWLGRFGKIDNGQVAVYMGYASRGEHALVDTRLYLPKEWANDRERRKKSGVPREIRFCTRHELALEMLNGKSKLLPHRWIAGDDEMGRSSAFRGALRDRNECYLLNVPSNTNIRDLEADPPPYAGQGPRPKGGFERVDKWVEALPKEAWKRIDVRDGEKGPLVVEITKARVVARTERCRGIVTEEVLVVTRSLEEDGNSKCDYSLSNATFETPLDEFARVEKARHRIEDCIERAKSEAGLAHYEVRNWKGWHHHQVLSLMAVWFLTLERLRGKKMDSSTDGFPGSNGSWVAVA